MPTAIFLFFFNFTYEHNSRNFITEILFHFNTFSNKKSTLTKTAMFFLNFYIKIRWIWTYYSLPQKNSTFYYVPVIVHFFFTKQIESKCSHYKFKSYNLSKFFPLFWTDLGLYSVIILIPKFFWHIWLHHYFTCL